MSRHALRGASLLAAPVAAALITLLPAGAGAQQKMAQKLVQYQKTPNNQKCSTCLHFVTPDSCKLVEGKIDANGWCSLVAPKPK